MRVQIVVNFEGTLAELFAALPKSIEVQNLQCLAPLSPAEPTQQTLKLTGAFRHMDKHTVAEIYAGFDAGLTIEQLMAQSGYSYRAVADRRKQWKKLRGLLTRRVRIRTPPYLAGFSFGDTRAVRCRTRAPRSYSVIPSDLVALII